MIIKRNKLKKEFMMVSKFKCRGTSKQTVMQLHDWCLRRLSVFIHFHTLKVVEKTYSAMFNTDSFLVFSTVKVTSSNICVFMFLHFLMLSDTELFSRKRQKLMMLQEIWTRTPKTLFPQTCLPSSKFKWPTCYYVSAVGRIYTS
jgi:hypothetical protein